MPRVLIIEDSVSQAAIMQEIVRQAGHEAVLCPDLQKGIAQILRAINPAVVLVDLVLLGADGKPVADGFQICREVKRVSKGQSKVIVVSSKDAEETAEWASLQGADAYLQKPFAVEDLVSVIDEVLGQNPAE